MNLVQVDRRIGNNSAAKQLIRRLIEKPEGYKMEFGQAQHQVCSGCLLEIGYAKWVDGHLILNPQLRDELLH